ncbi:Hypothetical predicted protein [Mytilus galloprovincialis]|uniref:CCHC-type domain-containing protein n=1 Tax=Mytilus galloprovincialis TaxID=29158 RepID=A0A8B6EWL0_MYTGA|nr:Hypothetical predicted protein [Mytilus galloprovincialis]
MLDIDTDHTAPNAHSRGESQPPAPSSDITDDFYLFRDYLDYKLVDSKADLASEQDNLSRKFNEEVGIEFKKEGNSIQYHFNDGISTGLHKIQKKGPNLDSLTNRIVSEHITNAKLKNKSIIISDSFAGRLDYNAQYESNTIADNSDDEKKIRQAESRAAKSIKETTKSQHPQPFRAGYGRREPAQYDTCHQCKQFGHWRKNCPLNRVQTQRKRTRRTTILNRYLMISI